MELPPVRSLEWPQGTPRGWASWSHGRKWGYRLERVSAPFLKDSSPSRWWVGRQLPKCSKIRLYLSQGHVSHSDVLTVRCVPRSRFLPRCFVGNRNTGRGRDSRSDDVGVASDARRIGQATNSHTKWRGEAKETLKMASKNK